MRYLAQKIFMLRTIVKTIAAIVVLLALFVGGAVVYVKLTGEASDEQLAQQEPPPDVEEQKLPDPQKPDPDAPVGASVQSLITPVKAGQNTSMTVRTNAGSKCSIEVKYGEVAGEDSGLVAKIADNYGIVTWSWTVDEAATVGTWPVKVTCKFNKKSAYVEGTLKIVK